MSDLKKFLQIDSTLFTKSLREDHPLRPLLEKALSEKTISRPQEELDPIFWKAERYDLGQAKLFQELSPEKKREVEVHISELNLALSSYIERSGHNYGAKMILLSETIEEKSLYSLFAAEEAIHLKEFQNFIHFDITKDRHWHPMLDCLASAIQDGEKNTLTFIIQVLLEGFGISHYSSLRDDCHNEELKAAYQQILKDEAKHHGAGIILAKESELNKLEKEQIFEYTRMFIRALQSADWLYKVVSSAHTREISPKEKEEFYGQIEYEKKLHFRLQKLKEMLSKVDQGELVTRLDAEGVFKPLKVS